MRPGKFRFQLGEFSSQGFRTGTPEIARAAKVALGTVGDVLADLEQRGHLALENPGPRRLLARARLQDEWITHYPIKLRPKLNARRFTAPARDWWQNTDVGQYHAYWGEKSPREN